MTADWFDPRRFSVPPPIGPYCCEVFQCLVSCAGERGLSILAQERRDGSIGFRMQSRGLSYDDEQKIKPCPVDVVINISTAIALPYCPFCGRRTEKQVRRAPHHFRMLAEEHKIYLTELP